MKNSIYSMQSRPPALRLFNAIIHQTFGSLRQPRDVARFAKSWIRLPLDYGTAQEIEATPALTFAELFPESATLDALPASSRLDRHSWNVRLDEEIYIGLAIRAIHAKKIFEIGTFNGGTTRYMTEAGGRDVKTYTLDLLEDEFNKTQSPDNFTGTQVGSRFHGSPVESQIQQLWGNSMTFDFAVYEGLMDFVFVDAAHDYKHGIVDSKSALRLVKPGGVIMWHDFTWPGLVEAIKEATQGQVLVRLAGTSLAVLRTGTKN